MLACKRLKGSHTFDVLAAALEEVYNDYNILDKLTSTTTDNASNFLEAFSHFTKFSGHGDNGDQSSENENDDNKYDDAVPALLYDILRSSNERSSDYRLPRQ